MTATFGVLSNTTFASRTNTTITAPASIGDGDLLLLFHVTGLTGTAPTQTLPAGFTQIGYAKTSSDGSFQVRSVVGYKIAASESGDYTVTHATASAGGVILRIDGSNTLSIDGFSLNDGNVGTTTTGLSVSPTYLDDMLAFFSINWDEAALAPPTGMTERLDSVMMYVATEALTTSGATGTRTQTHTINNPWTCHMVAIKDVATYTPPSWSRRGWRFG